MTHTSTEQPETLRLADAVRTHDDHPRVHFYNRVASELRRLHARVQELEASQAQRVPLTYTQINSILHSVLEDDDDAEWMLTDAQLLKIIRAAEAAHGITQEK